MADISMPGKAEVFPLDALFAYHKKHPHARISAVVKKIKKKKLHDELWFWWLQHQLEKIIEAECREGA